MTYDDIAKQMALMAAIENAFEEALRYRASDDISRYFRALRRIHELNAPAVSNGEYDPYIVDWTRIFTPIEEDAWYSIRTLGLPMFPQYPVGRYFADFADPWKKIVIECDSKKWHDRVKDSARDQDMYALGWEVWRLPGNRLVLGEDDRRAAHHIIRELVGLPQLECESGANAP